MGKHRWKLFELFNGGRALFRRRRDVRLHVDSATTRGIQGWAVSTIQPGRVLHIEVLADGTRMGITPANQPRPDLKEQGLSEGLGGFSFVSPGLALETLSLRVAETGDIFPLTGKTKSNSSKSGLSGMFEHLSTDLEVSGWAFDAGRPEHRCQVEIRLDGVPATVGIADLLRPDLETTGKGDGFHAFRITIPAEAVSLDGHLVEVLADGRPLSGSPKRLELGRMARLRLAGVRAGVIHLTLDHWPGGLDAVDLLANGVSLGERPWSEVLLHGWPLPQTVLDGRPRVFQPVGRVGQVALRGEPNILRCPEYRFGVLEASLEGVQCWAARTDDAIPVRLSFYQGDYPLATRVEPQADQRMQRTLCLLPERCIFDVVFASSLEGERPEVDICDADSGHLIAQLTLLRPHEALLDLSRAARRELPRAFAVVDTLLRSQQTGMTDKINVSYRLMPRPLEVEEQAQMAVIVPVYGGYTETVACLESVLAARNQTPCLLVVVNDNSPDAAIQKYLAELEARELPGMCMLHLPKNRGFVRAVNLGMKLAGDRDVILLNADTEVRGGWVDRLRAAAQVDARIGTVTPFSNNGEICTLPTICTSLPVADTALFSRVDEMAKTINPGKIVDIPVGVGFCLYIRRECLEETGMFDEAVWGKGYGEETDFCLKAAALGWRHVLAADCFVVHRGNVSFGEEKLQRIRESAQKISSRYPFYESHIHRFIKRDPVRFLRQAVSLGLLSEAMPPRRILHVSHSYKGGTERYLQDMAALDQADGYCPLILRFADNGDAVLELPVSDPSLIGLFRHPHQERYSPQSMRALMTALDMLAPECMHLHTPIGIPPAVLAHLVNTYPYVITVHDYAWLCPCVTMTDAKYIYCGLPDPADCDRCLDVQTPHPGLWRFAAGGGATAFRERFQQVLAGAGEVFGGSRDVQTRLEAHGYHAAFTIRPHPLSPESRGTMSAQLPTPESGTVSPQGQILVALFGGLSHIKGQDDLVACARYAKDTGLPLRFILIGYPADPQDLAGLDNIRVTGPYREEDLERLVAIHSPTLAWFPARWPETYSYTLSHAFRTGLHPVVTDIGAPAERVRERGVGTIYPLGASPQTVCKTLLRAAGQMS